MAKSELKTNLKILEILTEMAEKFPGLRFGQLLCSFDVLEYTDYGCGNNVCDPYYNKSKDILKRIKNSDLYMDAPKYKCSTCADTGQIKYLADDSGKVSADYKYRKCPACKERKKK